MVKATVDFQNWPLPHGLLKPCLPMGVEEEDMAIIAVFFPWGELKLFLLVSFFLGEGWFYPHKGPFFFYLLFVRGFEGATQNLVGKLDIGHITKVPLPPPPFF